MKANEQYCLDFGQKNIDAIRCATCGMLYVVGEESDEKHHAKFHAEFDDGVKWSVKMERPRKYFDDGSRIVAITKDEQKPVYDIINKLLKMSDGEMSTGDDVYKLVNREDKVTRFFLYVTHTNHLVGYICVERINEAFLLIDFETSTLDTEPQAAGCGVLYLWVHPAYRRKKIATKLTDIARSNIKEEGIVYRSRVAVCDPTENAVPFFNAYLQHKRPIKVYQSMQK